MIELIQTAEDGSKSYRITHTHTVEVPVLDDDGKPTGEMQDEVRDLHKPVTYAAAPGTPESEIEAIAAQVKANVEAGLPPFHREPTDAEKLAEAKAAKAAQIQSEADRRLEQQAGGRRQLQRLAIIGDASLRAFVRDLDQKEAAALAEIEAAESVEDVQAVTLA